MEGLQKTCLVVTIIGAIAWGMMGLFEFNLVEGLFGAGSAIARIVYVIVGICGLINIGILITHFDRK